MLPHLHINPFAVLTGFAFKVVLGYFWYGTWFKRDWNGALGMDPNYKPMPSMVRRARTLRWVGMLWTVYVVALGIAVIRPSSWDVGQDGPPWIYGLVVSVAVWTGFCMPQLLGRVAWERAPWSLFRIHGLFHAIALLVVGQILAWWP